MESLTDPWNYIAALINYKYGFWIPYFDMAAMMLMMILPVIALKSYDFLSRHAALKTKVLLYEKEMEVCRQHTLDREYTLREFQRLGKSMEESLDRIETFVSENRLEEAVSYIRRLLSETGRSSYGLVSSGNMMIDGLVNYKASYIRALHIDFSAEIRIPVDILRAGFLFGIFCILKAEEDRSVFIPLKGKRYFTKSWTV